MGGRFNEMAPASKEVMTTSINLEFVREQLEAHWDVVLTHGDEKAKLNKVILDLNEELEKKRTEIVKLKSAKKVAAVARTVVRS
jgi:hypothetical protein